MATGTATVAPADTREPGGQLRVTLPHLHPKQQEVAESLARFRVLAGGRRWGKSALGVVLCMKTALEGGVAWWVAPSYPIANIGWRQIKRFAKQIPGYNLREGERIAEMPSGGWVQVKSADNPDSLRGEGLDFVVLDEAPLMREEAWTEALRPALADKRGGALFIGTPKGHNWFWRLFEKALPKESRGTWQHWQLPTASNPYISPQEIEDACNGLPERVFRQEFKAEFLADAGGVFRGVSECATAQYQREPIKGHTYVFGVDWGKHDDFTVIAVLDLTDKSLADIDRFNQIDYTVQVGRLRALYERFKPATIVAERNSMGEPLIEQLIREGMPVEPFWTSNPSKTEVMDGLALAFERRDISILPEPTLITELQAYEMQRLPSGLLRYSAPAGMHDDCVMALALAWTGTTERRVEPRVIVL